MLGRAQTDYIAGAVLEHLLAARVAGEGWFVAAPNYAPYGNHVWHRDNAECIEALDEYAATFGETALFDVTARAITRSFRYFETKKEGIGRLVTMRHKLANPEFYNTANHPHARLSRYGDELQEPWHNIQYDSVARMVIALSKHLALTNDKALVEKCKLGLILAIEYLFDGIWDASENARRLTVCANEWEELEEPHLRGPLFSSVVGLLFSASIYAQRVLQEYVDLREIDLKEYERQTQSMFTGFFVRGGVIRMIKRFEEPPVGCCSSALWLLTSYDVVPVGGEIFNNTLEALLWNSTLRVEVPLDERVDEQKRKKKGVVLRRYELLTSDFELDKESRHVDTYWGGQAWLIATAQLATALALRGNLEGASDTLSLCLQARDVEGHLPEQFTGTYHQREHFDRWKGYTKEATPPPWLAWSHAEVLRAYTVLRRSA